MSTESYTLEVEITKSKHDRERTFSADALEGVSKEMLVWITERILESWHVFGAAPQRAIIKLTLELSA